MAKTYWNYRVVTRMADNTRIFSITEVHYKKGKPNAYAEDAGVLKNAEDVKSLKWSNSKIRKALG